MTRFARAKGSKASNERHPDEPTPWHEMKQQLEDSLATKQCSEKTKSAKELLAEKETPYYSTTIGNIKTDWADFETSKKKSQPPASKKPKTDIPASKTTDKPPQTGDLPSKAVKKSKKRKNDQDPTTITSNPTDSTEKKKKKRKKSQSTESSSTQKPLEVENKSENPKKPEETDSKKKLSKRQKRNQKNRKSNAAETSENQLDKKSEGNAENQTIKHEKSAGGKPQRPNSMRGPVENVGGKSVKKQKPPKVRDNKEHQRRKPLPSTRVIINGLEVEITMYEGFPVKKEDADRLTNLRKEMRMKGIPSKDINAAMKLERRKAEKALARVRKSVCFHCRKAGHNLSDCPELGKEECITGICFKCGSTEHTHFECRVNKKEEFRFASCFICRQQGHISKQCPDNPRGLYPDGGSCKICGDVTHLRKDCPDLVQEKEEATVTLQTIGDNSLEGLDGEKTKKIQEPQPKNKVVKF